MTLANLAVVSVGGFTTGVVGMYVFDRLGLYNGGAA